MGPLDNRIPQTGEEIAVNEAAEVAAHGQVKIPLKRVLGMIWAYARGKIGDQVRAVAFVVLYLLIAQLFVFKMPIANSLGVALGIGATILGLAVFLEGLFLGIMPLGEQCGLKLPGKAGLFLIAVFALVLGVTATLAEPAIAILRAKGGALRAWDAPLLFLLLNRGSSYLVGAVALGVGVAVVIGAFRFLFGWSFKPFVYLFVPVLVIATVVLESEPNLRALIGLAWDTGGVTTGPVTVPLVIALGVGLSRIAGTRRGGFSGLGLVTLASALPVGSVLLLAAVLVPSVPSPGDAASFFSANPAIRRGAVFVAGDEERLARLAAQAVAAGELSETELRQAFPDGVTASSVEQEKAAPGSLLSHAVGAVQATIPLVLVLLGVLLLLLRERIHDADVVALGIVFAVVGFFTFSVGMERGLNALGTQVGSALPRAYEETLREDRAILVKDGDRNSVFSVAGPDGPESFIWVQGSSGPRAVPFEEDRWNPECGTYLHVPVESAVFAAWGHHAGLAAVLVFVFVLGIGVTLAEPSLNALGATVEELTTGTYRKSTLVRTVAFGVGMGFAVGFGRILLGIPLAWTLAPAYVLALILTIFSPEDFSAVAWDAAGVTTGPITVPLVIATGLGLSTAAAESFGVVACASVFPVLAVLASGIATQAKARRSVSMEAIT